MRYAFVLLAVLASACAQPKGTVAVDLDEFSVTTEPRSVPAGMVRFEQKNVGAIAHELVVLKTELAPDALPLRAAEVDFEARMLEVVGRDKLLRGGATRTLRLQMRAGRYVLICNVPGHYQSGMRTGFEVR